MSINIVKWVWDLGNGTVVEKENPQTLYWTGNYDVKLTAVDADGTVYEVSKSLYIRVNEDNQSLNTVNYLNNNNSLHFGWKDEHGFGWSKNDRASWVLPFTSHSIYNYDDNGVVRTIVWDGVDNTPYIINTRDDYNGSAVYTDKAGTNGTGGTEIATTIVFPEVTGDMTHYDLTHVETNVMFRPEILETGFRTQAETGTDFTVDFTLITDGRTNAVETQYRQDYDKEVVFYYQNDKTEGNTRSRAIQIDTTTSQYQLLNMESYFKVNDRFKRPFSNTLTETQDAMAKFGSMVFWVTRGDVTTVGEDRKNYFYDRVAKDSYDKTNMTPTTGPDGKSESAVTFASNQTYTFSSAKTGLPFCWATQSPGAGWTERYDSDSTDPNSWKIYTAINLAYNSLLLNSGDYYDIRIINTASITDTEITLYADKYERFLPRY